MPDTDQLDRRTTGSTTGVAVFPPEHAAHPVLVHHRSHRPRSGAAPSIRSGPGVRIGVLSTYPPTQCGLATFSAALVEHLARTSARVGVVRVVDAPASDDPPEVVAQLVNGRPDSAAAAVHHLDAFDAVVVQHEYGIYGGTDGIDVLTLLEALTVPVVVVLHTVLADPTASQRAIVERLLTTAQVVVTMTETARSRLLAMYPADPARLTVVPHGATVHRSPAPDPGTDGPGTDGPVADGPAVEGPATDGPAADGPVGSGGGPRRRPLVLTWGLIGPGKGIEWAVDAMAELRDLRPRYLVLGETHPKVLDRDGEAYRESLVHRAAERGVTDLVEFDATYLGVDALADVVAGADVVLLPYDSREQVTSGVLIEAVAAGRPVVSTAFPHAVELLTDGPGLVVPQRDPAALAAALRRVLTEPGLARGLSASASLRAPELLWGAVATRYLKIAETLAANAARAVPT